MVLEWKNRRPKNPGRILVAPVFRKEVAKSRTKMLYFWHMSHWSSIQREALGSHGIVTVSKAREMGVFPAEIYRWRKMGRLIKVGRGVFQLSFYPSQGFVSDMAALLALVGEGAYLYGESAIALYGFCPTRSYVAFIAVCRRFRKSQIPPGVTIVKASPGYRPAYHDGIPCQKPMDAIRSCIGVLEKGRLLEAVDEAERMGFLMPEESQGLKGEILHGKATA